MSWRRYDAARASAYDAERAAPDDRVAEVRDVVVAEVAAVPRRLALDVGAGTGLWSDRLSRWTSLPVLALEPSPAMIAVLAGKRLAGVLPVLGRGEAVPVRDGACGVAWLSTVVHHFDDLPAAAAEIARVLAPGGVVLVRTSFPDQSSGEVYPVAFFPSAAKVATAFPTFDEAVGAFDQAGLGLRRRHAPQEVAAPTRTAFVQRVAARADSLLQELTDEEFATGLHAVRRWAEAEPGAPVHFRPDLLVFG